jgi:hypothetical protein
MKVFKWLRKNSLKKNISYVLKFLFNVEWEMKRLSNHIQNINDYSIENKYELTSANTLHAQISYSNHSK